MHCLPAQITKLGTVICPETMPPVATLNHGI